MTTNQKIQALRQAMRREGITAYLVPSSDPHQSEYVADHWKCREWLSGFTGSAGILVVTEDHAGLWTDSRYFLQAEKELADTCVTLQKQVVPHAPEHVNWLADNLAPGSTVGLDGRLFSLGQVRHLAKHFYQKNIEIRADLDLVAPIWTDRPAMPLDPVFELPPAYTGHPLSEKMARIRAFLEAQNADALLLTTLDDIAWTLNIRAADVEYNPVCISYLLIEQEAAYWFVPAPKVPLELQEKCWSNGIVLHAYDAIEDRLRTLPPGYTVLADTATLSARLYQLIPEGQVLPGDNPVVAMKGIKSETEIFQIRRAMRKDGAALVRLLRWLETEAPKGGLTEYDVAVKIAELRAEQGEYFGESFAAIIGYNANGAIVHYRPMPGESAAIRPQGILLMDSGGQYLHGTTDITRTIALSPPNDEQKRAYTAVLKGHIALAALHFPEGTKGIQIDALARMHLWQLGLNYGHGTGHGVGYFLNVHEGPQGITPSPGNSKGHVPFEPGMLTSNEPGYYETGQYGIRIENLILCVEAAQTTSGRFFRFETLSLCPIDIQLIDASMLHPEEKQWLNDYHADVLRELSPLLDSEELAWLEKQCRAL
jgi:Xaa-Pro aminopeptidase